MTDTSDTRRYGLSQLDHLEAEAIFIIREIVAENEQPGTAVLRRQGLGRHAASRGQGLRARRRSRSRRAHRHRSQLRRGARLPRSRGRASWASASSSAPCRRRSTRASCARSRNGSRNRIQTPVLLRTAERHGLSALFGGARRDEEKARAKERVFSFRDDFGQWDPKNQRPELWSLYNGRIHPGESIRCFPLSNWTELDIWQYIARENIELPSIYYAHEREVFLRDGMYFTINQHCQPAADEESCSSRRSAIAPSATPP